MATSRVLPLLILAILIAAAIPRTIPHVYAVDVEITQDGDYSSGNRSTWWGMKNFHPSATTAYSASSQSFLTLDDGNSYKIKYVTLHMYAIGSPLGTGYVKIYTHSGTFGTSSVPDALVATSDGFDVSTLTGSGTDYDFTFSGEEQVTLDQNTAYCAVWENPASGDIDNQDYIQIGLDTTSPSHEGNWASYRQSSWQIPGAADTATFAVYGELVAGGGQDLTFTEAGNLLLHDSATAGLDLARTYGNLLHLYAADTMNKEAGFQLTGTLALWAATTLGREWGFTLGGVLHLWAHSTIGKELAFTAANILHLWSSTATTFEIAAAGLNEVFTLLATLRLHAAALPTLEVRTPVEHAFNLYAAIHLHDSEAIAKELGYLATGTIRLWDSMAKTTEGVAQELTFILTETIHLIASVAATMETAALVLDAASIAGLALIIALVAVALIMVRRRE